MKIIKAFTIVSVLLVSYAGFAQDFPYKNEKIFYQFIDTVHGSKGDIFDKLKNFLVTNFDSKDYIRIEEKESGKLIAKPILEIEEFSGPSKGKHLIRYSLYITVTDYLVAFQMYDLLYDLKNELEVVKKIRCSDKNKMKGFNDVIKQVNAQFNSLHKAMISKVTDSN